MRRQARRGNGRFTRNTMENTFGLHCEVCPNEACRRLNPSPVGAPRPTHCHACGASLVPCGECNGTGRLTQLGGDWGKTPDTKVACWACGGTGHEKERAMAGTHTGARAQTIRIYLRHHKDPEGRYQPREVVCQDYTDGKGHEQKGCGATVWRYLTFPNAKAMRFDGLPIVVEGSEVNMGDGSIVANVQTTNVHYSTCAAKKKPEPPAPPVDRLTATEGR